MVWLNLVLGILETLVIVGGQYYFLSHNERSICRKKALYPAVFLGEGLLLLAVSIYAGQTGGWLSIIFHPMLPVLIGIWGFHRKWKALVFDCLFGGFQILMIEGGIALCSQLIIRFQLYNRLSPVAIGNLAMGCKIFVMIPGTFLFTWWFGRKEKGKLSRFQIGGILVMPVVSLIHLLIMLKMNGIYQQLYGPTLFLIDTFALLGMNCYFFYLLSYLFRSKRLEQELALFQMENQLRYQHYEELEQKYQESRKIIHDMKNHLQAVEQLYAGHENETGERYVKDLYHLLNVLGEQYYTSNKMLNIILNEKLRLARNKGIQVTANIGDVDLSDMKEIDLTAVFANLLDNAVEAAEEGWISVKMDEVRDFRVVQIANSKGAKKTEKAAGHMGLGLENVKNTLEKYHGSLKIEETDREYRVQFVLPGKESI